MFGQTYAPLGADSGKPRLTGPGEGAQQAIQVIGLHFPRVFGAQSPAPPALLTSPGSGGLATGMPDWLRGVLSAVLGPSAGQGQTPSLSAPTGMPPMPSSIPAPNVQYGQPPSDQTGRASVPPPSPAGPTPLPFPQNRPGGPRQA